MGRYQISKDRPHDRVSINNSSSIMTTWSSRSRRIVARPYFSGEARWIITSTRSLSRLNLIALQLTIAQLSILLPLSCLIRTGWLCNIRNSKLCWGWSKPMAIRKMFNLMLVLLNSKKIRVNHSKWNSNLRSTRTAESWLRQWWSKSRRRYRDQAETLFSLFQTVRVDKNSTKLHNNL